MGVGEATGDSKKPSVAAEDLAMIAGQKAVVTRADSLSSEQMQAIALNEQHVLGQVAVTIEDGPAAK